MQTGSEASNCIASHVCLLLSGIGPLKWDEARGIELLRHSFLAATMNVQRPTVVGCLCLP